MNDITKWLGRTIVAGAAALVIISGSAFAQGEPPPAEAPAVTEAAPAEAAPAEAAPAEAAPAAPMLNTGDTAWMLTSTALVLMMTIPGLALFYGGMVRKKNVLSTTAQSFAITALVSVLWMVIGYSLAFTDGGGMQSIIGGFSYMFLGPM